MERLIVDILEITEGLMGTFLSLKVAWLADEGRMADGDPAVGLPAAPLAQGKKHPDHEHGRPDPEKFGDGDGQEKKEQVGFSSQC